MVARRGEDGEREGDGGHRGVSQLKDVTQYAVTGRALPMQKGGRGRSLLYGGDAAGRRGVRTGRHSWYNRSWGGSPTSPGSGFFLVLPRPAVGEWDEERR